MFRQFFRTVALVAGAGAMLYLAGCKKESNPAAPPPEVEHPPATTVYLIVTELDGSGNPTAVKDTCIIRDTTQTSIKQYVTGTLNLTSGKSYNGTFILYDESVTPREDLTADINSEKDAHVFKFTAAGGIAGRVAFSNFDTDSHGLAFGLNFKMAVSGSGTATGNIHVILEHHDDGNKAGSEFDLDLDRDFSVALQ